MLDDLKGLFYLAETWREQTVDMKTERETLADWDRLHRGIKELSREALVDLCLYITKDAHKAGTDKKAVFESASNAELIDGLKKRHINFRNMTEGFEAWQDKRLAQVASGGVSLEPSEALKKKLFPTINADCRELELRAAAAYQGQRADEYMHKLAQMGKLSNKTAIEELGRVAAQAITAQLDKGSKPAYVEAEEAVKIAREEAAGHANSIIYSNSVKDIQAIGNLASVRRETTKDPGDLSKAQIEDIHEDMKRHSKGARAIVEQTQKYFEQHIYRSLGVPKDVLFPRLGGGLEVKNLKMRDSIFSEGPSYVWKPADMVATPVEHFMDKDLSDTRDRGFPVYEGTSNPPERLTKIEKPVGEYMSGAMTQADLNGCSNPSQWKVSERVHRWNEEDTAKANLQKKKERIARMQRQVAEIEAKHPTVGSPSSLSDWLKKPLGSF